MYDGLGWAPYVSGGGTAAQGTEKDGEPAQERPACLPGDHRGTHDRQDLLGQGLVRQPGIATAISRTACRAGGPMCATDRSSICRWRPAGSRRWSAARSIYTVEVKVQPVAKPRWQSICADCAGAIDSLVELLQGRLSKGVMERICQQQTGLFPSPEGDQTFLQLPGLGRDVQARRGRALWHRRPAGPAAGAALQAARSGREGTDRQRRQVASARQVKARRKVLGEEDLSKLFGLEIAESAS